MMKTIYIYLFLAFFCFATCSVVEAQVKPKPKKPPKPVTTQIATTEDGKPVVLSSDGTWKYAPETGLKNHDTTPRATGIGGIFFRSKNPKGLREWYGKNLGLAIDDYGSPFEFRNANRPGEINYLRWNPFEEGTDYFKPSEKEFMINYRVNNIQGLVKKLRDNGVTIVDSIQTFEYGKFVHIMDTEGNKIELWEPIDSFFTKMGGPTTK